MQNQALEKLAELNQKQVDRLIMLSELPPDQLENLLRISRALGPNEQNELEQVIAAKRWARHAIILASAAGGILAGVIEFMRHADPPK